MEGDKIQGRKEEEKRVGEGGKGGRQEGRKEGVYKLSFFSEN